MSVLDTFLIHLCTILRGAATAGDYGHSPYLYTTPAATTTNVPCRLMIMSAQEKMAMGSAGTVISDYSLHIAYRDAPSSLVTLGAETKHRVTNVTRRDNGVTVDAGPFEIDRVLPSAGDTQHLILHLRRIS